MTESIVTCLSFTLFELGKLEFNLCARVLVNAVVVFVGQCL